MLSLANRKMNIHFPYCSRFLFITIQILGSVRFLNVIEWLNGIFSSHYSSLISYDPSENITFSDLELNILFQ